MDFTEIVNRMNACNTWGMWSLRTIYEKLTDKEIEFILSCIYEGSYNAENLHTILTWRANYTAEQILGMIDTLEKGQHESYQ
jgi:hypothetical protein